MGNIICWRIFIGIVMLIYLRVIKPALQANPLSSVSFCICLISSGSFPASHVWLLEVINCQEKGNCELFPSFCSEWKQDGQMDANGTKLSLLRSCGCHLKIRWVSKFYTFPWPNDPLLVGKHTRTHTHARTHTYVTHMYITYLLSLLLFFFL